MNIKNKFDKQTPNTWQVKAHLKQTRAHSSYSSHRYIYIYLYIWCMTIYTPSLRHHHQGHILEQSQPKLIMHIQVLRPHPHQQSPLERVHQRRHCQPHHPRCQRHPRVNSPAGPERYVLEVVPLVVHLTLWTSPAETRVGRAMFWDPYQSPRCSP